MATVVKDFKVKNGLIVEGTTATVNNFDVLTKKTDDQTYIVNLIGGTATSANEANKVVKRDANGNFAAGAITANLTGDVTGNADTATTLETSRTIELTGDVTGQVNFNGSQNVQISTTLNGSFATDAEVATAKGEAIADAAADATSKANAAQTAAELTASNALSAAVTTLEGQITDAETDANTYTDNAITALNLSGTYDALGAAAAAQLAAEGYADTAIANLVDSAPATLDTLNELAAALQDNPDIIGDLQTIAAGKQDTLTAGANIDITGATISVTGLDAADISDFNTAALAATAAAYDMYGAAAAAQLAAENYADGLAINYDAAGSASTAQTNAETFTTNAINGLDTDDIEEGGANLYHTDARAKASAANLLLNASLTNIAITGDSTTGLIITAENGVADSDTDDLVEGTTNLYFTDARAVTALEAVTPDFPAVEIASVAKQVAAQATVATASTSTAVLWAKADYRSAEFLVKIANGSHTEVSKVILTLDTSDNVAITEYAMVGTNGDLGSVSADVSGNDVRLRVATLNNDSTVAVVGTLLK
jgi:hypothetical protein